MTPEREAQMREMFQKRYGERPNNDPLLEATWDDRKRVWDYCLNSLEPMVRDAERYQWLRSDDIEVLPGQREINVYMERLPHTEEPTVLLIETELDKAIDAAMSAALEDGNAIE